jgi:hypothetical protein
LFRVQRGDEFAAQPSPAQDQVPHPFWREPARSRRANNGHPSWVFYYKLAIPILAMLGQDLARGRMGLRPTFALGLRAALGERTNVCARLTV